MDRSGHETVVLENITEETSGIYKCEVMGDAPAFRTAVHTKSMFVIGKQI